MRPLISDGNKKSLINAGNILTNISEINLEKLFSYSSK